MFGFNIANENSKQAMCRSSLRKLARVFGRLSVAALATVPLFAASPVFAARLPCVERAINWKNASDKHDVMLTMISLHANSIASYTTGPGLTTSQCSRAPYAEGIVDCLVMTSWGNGLLSDRSFPYAGKMQPFDVTRPLPLIADSIPVDTLGQVHLRQPNATYDFDPRCVGDLLIGDDQWGNHWTLSFRLIDSTIR